MPHPTHIHCFSFQKVERLNSPFWVAAGVRFGNGRTVSDLGWMDTVLVWPGETDRIAIGFAHDFPASQTYLFHCHTLEHEDARMMVNFRFNSGGNAHETDHQNPLLPPPRPMWFSATASFVAGTGAYALRVATLRETRCHAETLFAAIPLMFGLQQMVESALWLSFRFDTPQLNRAMT